MKQRLGLLLAVFIVAGSTQLFSFGLGLQGNFNAGEVFAPGIAITMKFEEVPLYFAVNWRIEDKVQTVGMTADYWALNKQIVQIGDAPLNWFFGLGAFCNLTFDQNDNAEAFRPSLGLRVPVGLNMYLADGVIEPFVQVAPSFGVHLIPSIGADNVYWPISLGFRVWFK